jgi:hypothetical protein
MAPPCGLVPPSGQRIRLSLILRTPSKDEATTSIIRAFLLKCLAVAKDCEDAAICVPKSGWLSFSATEYNPIIPMLLNLDIFFKI